MSLKYGLDIITKGFSIISKGASNIFIFNNNTLNHSVQYRPKTFKDDAEALRSDWEAVYNDIDKVTKRKE